MSTCPLCESEHTELTMPFSDPDRNLPFFDQRCSNPACELPCKLWERIRRLVSNAPIQPDDMAEYASRWEEEQA